MIHKVLNQNFDPTLPYIYVHDTAAHRVGDLAGAVAVFSNQPVPNRRIIIRDPLRWRTHYSRQLDVAHYFKDVANDLLVREDNSEIIVIPGDTSTNSIRHTFAPTLWEHYRRLRKSCTRFPTVKPQPDALKIAHNLLKKYGLKPDNFVLLQPLFDAGYDKFRNAPKAHWNALRAHIDPSIPVALLTSKNLGKGFPWDKGFVPLFEEDPPYDVSIALSALAKVFVGGQSGLILWATMFRTPIVAVYREWRLRSVKARHASDSRPISFGAPVVHAELASSPAEIGEKINLTYCGVLTTTVVKDWGMDLYGYPEAYHCYERDFLNAPQDN